MTRRDLLLDRHVHATAGGRSQQSFSSGIAKPYTWRRRRLGWASRPVASMRARWPRNFQAWSAAESQPMSVAATVSDSAGGFNGPVHSVRQDLMRAHHECLPGARIIIARPPSVHYREAAHAPLLQPAEFISQSSDGRSILGVLQCLEDVCFKIHVPFISMSSPAWPPVDELRCILAYSPNGEKCEFFCNSHDVTLIGETSAEHLSVKLGQIQIIEPGMWTVAVSSDLVSPGNGPGCPRAVVEFLLLERTYQGTLSGPTVAEDDAPPTSPAEAHHSTAAIPNAAPVDDRVAEFVMGTVQSPEAETKLASIPEEEPLRIERGPFYCLRDRETLRITTRPSGSNNAGIERRYASTAESYQVTRLRKIDRNRHSSVFACIHSKLPHTTLVAKALNVKPGVRNSITSLANHWKNEVDVLKKLNHNNIVKIRTYDARFFTVYLEHLPDSLASYPEEPGFTPKDVETILLDVASALTYLDEQRISHNDIKPRNIAYSPERGAVVLDFGLATQGSRVPRKAGGTAWYVPPEVLYDGARSPRGNVWAFGITMLYVLGIIGTPEDSGSAWDFLNLKDPNGPDRVAMEGWLDLICDKVDALDWDDPVQFVVFCMMDQDPLHCPAMISFLEEEGCNARGGGGYGAGAAAAAAATTSEESGRPKFWIEFRTFDDGMHTTEETSSSSTPAASFPQFVRLPPELRLKIWEYLVRPRIVVACCLERDGRLPERRAQLRKRTAGESTTTDGHDDDGGIANGSCSPVLLRINREARSVGLRFYELTFSWRISKLLSDTPVSQPARVWFNFALDALYLTGELEAFDAYGFNSPMVYFLRPEDTRRVRHVACAFAELGYPRLESDQIFGCLWHVADRFRAAERLLLALGPGEEEVAHCKKLAASKSSSSCGREAGCVLTLTDEDNVMQKIWEGWMGTVRGRHVQDDRTQLVDKKMVLVREESLADVISSF
ncbi:Protein kinase-like domain protein [Cordyceps fumosorosea ARSEF 2679]|uniref:Protein kinase-like domain protein n=1 Tax=Cordyceps fumosorosea (strain ARSEF 2679) TaxID=1081104 RepID=A0A167S575_CORFA|nr:Protein kinase-like domain protein [Cordyceps fumosorosea ARSEF 2679]OAA59266.1 Protein kinase-like domain protein [Cordyceps fumosorosea ARSEF 2679]